MSVACDLLIDFIAFLFLKDVIFQYKTLYLSISRTTTNSHTVGDVPSGVVKHAIRYCNLVVFNDAFNFYVIVRNILVPSLIM